MLRRGQAAHGITARGKIGVRPLRLDWKLERRAQALAEYLAQVDEGLRVPYWSGECGEGENAAVVRKNSNMRRAMEIASESWWVMTWRTSRIMKQMGNRFFLQWTPSPFRRLANASMNYARSAEERMWLADGVFEVKDMALYGRYTQVRQSGSPWFPLPLLMMDWTDDLAFNNAHRDSSSEGRFGPDICGSSMLAIRERERSGTVPRQRQTPICLRCSQCHESTMAEDAREDVRPKRGRMPM